MLDNIEGVIFDLDGTIIDSMWIWNDLDDEFLKRRNIKIPKDLMKGIEGLSFTETAHYFKNYFKLEESIEDIKKEWIEIAEQYYKNKVELKTGIKELLDIIQSKNIKIGIATSCARELAETVLNKNKIHDYFDVIVTSCEVNKGKPSPDVYLEAAKKLKINNTEHILAFEDTIPGTKAAKKAGMNVVVIYDEYSKNEKDKLKQIGDYYIHSFEEINNKYISNYNKS